MRRRTFGWIWLVLLGLALGCGDDDASGPDAGGGDGSVDVDSSVSDAAVPDAHDHDVGPTEDADVPSDSGPVECDDGFQDEDGDGECLPDCDPFYCGPTGTCSIVDGARHCDCDEGFTGPECNFCAPGYRVDGGCVLDVPELVDIVFWVDAGATASMNREAGTNLVNSWRDRRGTMYGVLTSFGSNRPTYTANAINGRAAVHFDGVSDELSLDGFTGLSGSHYTVFVVAFASDAEDSVGLVEARVAGAVGMIATWGTSRSSLRFIHRMPVGTEGGDNAGFSAPDRSRPGAFALRRRGLEHAVYAYEAGDPRGGAASVVRMQEPFISPVTLKLGTSGGTRMLGHVAELIIVNRGLTDAEMDRITLYLAAKYRLED
ncbi:MAG: hypothetical protein KF901_14870 [Myxococcales bacterium]|nr:hypothetical protein [Myxococcales bacterium]